MKTWILSILLVASASPAFGMMEMTCTRAVENGTSKLVLKSEIQGDLEVVTLTDYFADHTARQSWNVRKEKQSLAPGKLSHVLYLDDQTGGKALSLDVDMTQKLEYAVYRSKLTVTQNSSARAEDLLCAFFYQFP